MSSKPKKRAPVQFLCEDCMRSLTSRILKSEKGMKLKAMRGLAPHEDKTCFFDNNKARYVLIGASPEALRKRMQ